MVIAFVTSFRGELAALAAALIWAIASLLFMGLGRQLSPLMLNLIKSSIAIALILLTLFLQSKSLPQVGLWAIGLLLLSGAIGIGLGDTAYFGSINCLGARRALLLESLAPPMTAMLASVFLREQLKAIGLDGHRADGAGSGVGNCRTAPPLECWGNTARNAGSDLG